MKPVLTERASPEIAKSEGWIDVDSFWLNKRYDFTSGNLDFLGKHRVATASTADTEWRIWKYTWSGSSPSQIQGPLVGSWDDRASLGW